jgi:uncharacterized protein YcfJ
MMVLVLAASVAGCESMGENTKKGAGLGALAGAAVGGIVGHQGGHGWEGALIGGATGAVLGGAVGNEADKRQQEVNKDHITIIQIAEMGQKGIPEDVIISEIDRTRSKYTLTSETIAYLKDNKISDKVINRMMAATQ